MSYQVQEATTNVIDKNTLNHFEEVFEMPLRNDLFRPTALRYKDGQYRRVILKPDN